MRPTYVADFIPNPGLALDWLRMTEARQEYFMSDVPRSYTYGKGEHAREYHSAPYSDVVRDIQDELNRFGAAYNVCFLNRYDTQKHQLGWHADDSPTMDRDHPIAVVSFGAEREIWWKLQSATGVVPPEDRQKLGHGSLFVMPAGFQDLYFHRIPRADRECGVRVSLTFRRYTDG
jgi:alkylated DNA repair dioxygenase AlkB